MAVADARSRVAADVHRLLSVQVIHHLEQGEEARESIAYLLLALRSEDLVASLRDDLGIVGEEFELTFDVLHVGQNRECVNQSLQCQLVFHLCIHAAHACQGKNYGDN